MARAVREKTHVRNTTHNFTKSKATNASTKP
jgi:hypothetical protein